MSIQLNKTHFYYLLAFALIFSKNLVIFNEELLIALIFTIFVSFSFYYLSGPIQDFLDERHNIMKNDLQKFLLVKKKVLSLVISDVAKQAVLPTALMLAKKEVGLSVQPLTRLNIVHANFKKHLV
jgi:TRAP-type uncharacterized transport system fused permease subunit